ncbi:MAG TPA: DUF6600 domain-containing protein [Bryobacteraceae bacterium]|nr:DUF6600 domain-containing protein [Bryobacteraceae bacterium]
MKANRYLLAMALVLTGTVAVARAQENGGPENDPEHSVARISVLAGDVSIQRGDSGEQSAAAVNAPLVTGDVVTTGPGAHAEIQFDSANVVRLASDSEVRLNEVAAARYQLQVARGTVMFSVVRDSRAQVEVSTPAVSMRPVQRGAYRVTVRDDGLAEITTRAGEAEIYTPRGVEKVPSGRTMIVRGTASDPEFQIVAANGPDEFDRWNEDRDRSLSRSRSAQYVSPDIYGTEDLDANGRWVDVAPYGRVWSPANVGPDWAPYREGRWVWEDWYGWTWVSADPWGWAPYHYGRWFNSGPYGWCWYPGPVYARHYWSPALVAFFGFGGFHVGIGFGGAGFGWVPLAPYEPFYPWWGRGFYGGYRNHNVMVNNIHIVNNVNITNVYRNARIGNGASVVNSGSFGSGRVGNISRISGAQLSQASLVRGQVPIAPTAASLRFSDRATAAIPRVNATNGRFFSHAQPVAVNRVPFAQQQQSLAQISRQGSAGAPSAAAPNSGGARSMWQSQAAAPRGAAQPMQPAARTGASVSPQASTQGGWRRVGEPARPTSSMNTPANAPAARNVPPPQNSRPPVDAMRPSGATSNSATSSGGWRRFGDAPRAGGPSFSQRNAQPGNQPQAAPHGGNGPASSWQRFGEPAAPRGYSTAQNSGRGWGSTADRPATAQPRGNGYQNSPSESWHRFQPGADRPSSSYSPPSMPRYESSPRYQSPGYQSGPSYSRPERLQIAPPIVRERSMPRSEPRYGGGGAYGGGGYSGGHSAPRAEPAPRSSGGGGGNYHGGGGGGSHPSGGGGGGHASGGSSGHSGRNR